jgi:hypothetical protein
MLEAGKLLERTVAAIVTGIRHEPLGLVDLGKAGQGAAAEAVELLRLVAEHGAEDTSILRLLQVHSSARNPANVLLRRGIEDFLSYYSEEAYERAGQVLSLFEEGIEPGLLAEEISRIWTPELMMRDEDILPKWRLSGLSENPRPIRPTEVVIQLNALYTLPESIRDG